MNKPGRNDPCYCGSGLKYKKCHMPSDQAAEKDRRDWIEAARFLRRELMKFARQERFAEAFADALPLYWNSLYDVSNAEEMSPNEALRFFDWFTFDYLPGQEPRLIERYHAEKGAELTARQQDVLDAWLGAPPAAAYEFLDYEDQIFKLRDFMTGDLYDVAETSGKGDLEAGDLILARLVPVQGTLEFSTTAAYLPKDEIGDLAQKLTAARGSDAAANPADSDYSAFMRRNNTLLIHHALEQAKRLGRPPVARLDRHQSKTAVQMAAHRLRRLRPGADPSAETDLDSQTAARRVKNIRPKH